MQHDAAPLIVASDGHPFRMMTDSDKFNFIKHIRNDLFKYEGEDEDWEEMNDYERFEVRRMLLMQQTERQKELAESRYAPEKDPEMIMGYERFMFAYTFNQRLGNLERGNEGFNYIDPLATFHIADSWWESEKRVVDCFNNPALPRKFDILTREESEAKRRREMPASDDEEVEIVSKAASSNQRIAQNRGQEGKIEELILSSDSELDVQDRIDVDEVAPVQAGTSTSSSSRDRRGFADDSEIDSGEEGDEDDRARSPTPPMSEVRRGKKRALSISSEAAHQLPTPRLTTSRSVSLQKPSPTRHSSYDAMSGPAEVETVTDEETDLRGKIVKRSLRGKKKEAKRTIQVNRVRTNFNPRKQKVFAPNPFSETLLREHFASYVQADTKPLFRLSNFEVTSDPDTFLALIDLFNLKSGYEISGDATPAQKGSEGVEEDWGALEGTGPRAPSPTPSSPSRRITLHFHDRPRLAFTLHGFVIDTGLCRFILQNPSEDYAESTLSACVLLNIWAFGRSKRIRGAYSEDDREVKKVAQDVSQILEDLKEEQGEDEQEPNQILDWQKKLPADWRCSVSKLELEKEFNRLLFENLPNIPFVVPDVYKMIASYLLPHSLRTDGDPIGLASLAESERKVDSELIVSLTEDVKKWKSAPFTKSVVMGLPLGENRHPDPSENFTRIRRFEKMRVKDDPLDRERGTIYQVGDVVLVSPATSQQPRLKAKKSPDSSGSEADGEDSDWESVGESRESGSDEEEAEKGDENPTRMLWFAKIESIFVSSTKVKEEDESDNEDEDAWDDEEVQLHITYFTTSAAIPKIGPYGAARELFLLDSCCTIAASTLVKKVEYRALKPGDAAPRTGFYSSFSYDVQDGSIQDTKNPTPFEHCDRMEVAPCASCETDLAFAAASEIKLDDEINRKNWTPFRFDDDDEGSFRYANRQYHQDDFILLSPKTLTLPNVPPTDPRRWPLRLAQLLSITPQPLPEPSQSPGVTNLGRLAKLKVRWLIRRSETKLRKGPILFEREVFLTDAVDEYIDVNRLEGIFKVHHVIQLQDLTKADADIKAILIYERDNPLDFFYDSKLTRKDGAPLEVLDDHELPAAHANQLNEMSVKPGTLELCVICRDAEEESRNDRRRVDEKLRGTQRGRPVLEGLSLYSGGGGLDHGLEMGCKPFHTKQAVELVREPASVFQANHDADNVYRGAASNYLEDVFYGRRDRSFFASITAGAPCQGFSSANMYKKVDDLRCLEPFVFLSSLATFRPLYAVFENVKGFLSHALPAPGSPRGSFLQLFVATAVKLRYQVRWTLVNSAGYGAPQSRRRLIVQLALPGVPLPDVPRPSHSYNDAMHPFDNALREENYKKMKIDRESSSYGPNPTVTVKDAIGDLPSYSVEELYNGEDDTYELRPFGCSWNVNPSITTPYPQPLPQTSYQLQSRTYPRLASSTDVVFSRSVTSHICGALSPVYIERLRNLGIKGENGKKGNYEDLIGLDCAPELPPYLLRASETRRRCFWSRLQKDSVVATLRTTFNIDGASHGSRVHYDQARPLSKRELIRIQGLPDSFEMQINNVPADSALTDMDRIIGNGVPVPLAEAFGRSLADVVYPMINEELSSPNPLHPNEDLFERIWRERCAGDQLIVDANHPVVPVAPVQQENFGGYDSDDSDCIVMTP